MANKLWLPPEIKPNGGDSIIFIAGPIQGAPDWQSEAVSIFNELADDLLIASPRRDYLPGGFVYEDQVDWEVHYREEARENGVMLYWLAKQAIKTPGRAYAQTSRFELGEDKERSVVDGIKLVIGIEEGFGNERYIRRRFDQECPKVPILSNLVDTCEVALELLDD